MSKLKKINFKEKMSKISDYWSPKVVAEMNEYQFKMVKIKDDFEWHSHDDTDEVFIVLKGDMNINFRDQVIKLLEGEMLVVPKGVEHKPYADEECEVMIVEPRGVINTGNFKSDLTADNDIWI